MDAIEVFCRPRSAPLLEHPSISSALTFAEGFGDDLIADGVSLLNVVRMLGPGEPVRTA